MCEQRRLGRDNGEPLVENVVGIVTFLDRLKPWVIIAEYKLSFVKRVAFSDLNTLGICEYENVKENGEKALTVVAVS